MSAVELFVAERPENAAASFPARSCTAAFDVAALDAGARYATVITAKGPSAGDNVSTTVDPLTTALVGVNKTALAVTVKALAAAVVACNDSLNVNTSDVPFAFNVPEVKVGTVVSAATTKLVPRSPYAVVENFNTWFPTAEICKFVKSARP
jgi:hypothetical protein